MKTIAEQIYNAFNRTRAVVNSDAYVNQEYCMQIAEDCRQAKSNLIDILSKHPNWDADNLRVHFNKDYIRVTSTDDARGYLRNALRNIIDYINRNYIFGSRDSREDGVMEMFRMWSLCNYMIDNVYDFCDPQGIKADLVDDLRGTTAFMPFTDGDLTISFSDAHIHQGAKCTKQVMKLMRQYYFDKLPEDIQHSFLQSYSQYADAMNPMTITRHTVLSVNPVDFLYMSVGNSWTSCHNIIDGGGYCGGAESYAYDQVSMIFYTVDADTPDDLITTAPKINRQMNFYNGDALLSVRVYPQSCDGDSTIYNECKGIVQQILADCQGRPNLWKETPWGHISAGYQYKDYVHFGPYKAYTLSDFTLSDRLKSWCTPEVTFNPDTEEVESIDTSMLYIGSYDAICPCCGEPLDTSGSPICSSCNTRDYICENCGERVSDSDAYWVGDYVYCEYCRDELYSYCDCCESDRPANEVNYYRELDRYICDYCVDEYYERCEDCGDIFDPDNAGTCIPGYGWVCDDCLDGGGYIYCDDCGRYFCSEDVVEATDGNHYCTECAQERELVLCPVCGLYEESGCMVPDNETGELICESCHRDRYPDDYAYCEECHELEHKSNILYVDGMRICTTCAVGFTHECQICGDRHHDNNLIIVEGHRVCKECYDKGVEVVDDRIVLKNNA